MLASPKLDRREFTLRSALALLGGVTITITTPGCGGGGGGSTGGGSPTGANPPTGTNADTVGAVSNNHGHRASITSAQLVAGGSITLDIRGDADHAHTVELSSAELVRIRSQETVSKECSSTSAHTHMVSFSRGGEPTGPGY
jgi:hypothetical protein